MKITNIHVDDHGHSYFGEVDLPQSGNERRISAKPQEVKYWQMSRTLPGHYVDFTQVADPMFVSVLSGRMELTVSNGEKRYFSRGDMFMLQDTAGQGHCTRTLGYEACETLLIAMPGNGEFKS
ncbi:MAG: cupin domain-containing protein [Gammaproteobacteria bacterium]